MPLVQDADSGLRPVEWIRRALRIIIVIQLGLALVENKQRFSVMIESLFANSHLVACEVVFNCQRVTIGVPIDLHFDFESLFIAVLSQGEIACGKHLVNFQSAHDQILNFPQHAQDRCLTRAIGTEEDVYLVEFELEIGQTSKIIGIESLNHWTSSHSSDRWSSSSCGRLPHLNFSARAAGFKYGIDDFHGVACAFEADHGIAVFVDGRDQVLDDQGVSV